MDTEGLISKYMIYANVDNIFYPLFIIRQNEQINIQGNSYIFQAVPMSGILSLYANQKQLLSSGQQRDIPYQIDYSQENAT